MPVTVLIPTLLRGLVGGGAKIELPGDNVREVLLNLEKEAPAFRNRLLNEKAEIRRFMAVFVNGKDVRKEQGADTRVGEGDEIALVPAAGGG